MKKVILITDIDFWNRGGGHQCRINTLVNYLCLHTLLTVVYIGKVDEEKIFCEKVSTLMNIVVLEEKKNLSPHSYGRKLGAYLRQNAFDFCIIEYIHNAYFLNYLPKGIKTILDAHDIVNLRTKSFKKHKYSNPLFDLPAVIEYRIFNAFDFVMLICRPDILSAKRYVPEEKLILTSHSCTPSNSIIRENVLTLGFIGSDYIPNQDAMHYFLEQWSKINKNYNVVFNIYGKVTHYLKEYESMTNVKLIGFVHDLERVYNEIDIVINPVRFGAGIKIKNIEALAFGKPLITTLHSARGLETGINKAFLVADKKQAFDSCLDIFINDFATRMKYSAAALTYISENFNAHVCFDPLLRIINK
jgi:glycosyltransferase involved in cell wall biosynthesis